MEQVVHHLGVGTVVLHLQIESGVHVHRHRLNALAGLGAKPFEERADRLSGASLTEPQYLLGVRVDDNGGVAVALEQRELVHDQAPDPASVRLLELVSKALMVNRAHGVPVQPHQLRHMRQGQQSCESSHPLDHVPSQCPPPCQPVDTLDPWTTVRTAHTAHRQTQPYPVIEQIALAHAAPGDIVDQ